MGCCSPRFASSFLLAMTRGQHSPARAHRGRSRAKRSTRPRSAPTQRTGKGSRQPLRVPRGSQRSRADYNAFPRLLPPRRYRAQWPVSGRASLYRAPCARRAGQKYKCTSSLARRLCVDPNACATPTSAGYEDSARLSDPRPRTKKLTRPAGVCHPRHPWPHTPEEDQLHRPARMQALARAASGSAVLLRSCGRDARAPACWNSTPRSDRTPCKPTSAVHRSNRVTLRGEARSTVGASRDRSAHARGSIVKKKSQERTRRSEGGRYLGATENHGAKRPRP